MTEHKFKVGDVVQTKPMKVTSLYWGMCGLSREGWAGEFKFRDSLLEHLVPIPAPDADVVELVARAICKTVMVTHNPDDYQIDDRKLWQWYEPQAQAAITALTSSGYTRSPKPDVNQMMLEALKRAKEFAIEWRGHIDDAGHTDASDEIEEIIRAAFAARSIG